MPAKAKPSPGRAKAAGIVAFAAVGAWVGVGVFAGSLGVAAGGKPFAFGRPVVA